MLPFYLDLPQCCQLLAVIFFSRVLPTPGYYLLFGNTVANCLFIWTCHSVANSWLLFTLFPQCCQLLAVIYSFSTVLPTPGCYLLFFHSVANSWLLFTLWPQCCQLLAIIYSLATVLPNPSYYLLFGHSVAKSWLLFTL